MKRFTDEQIIGVLREHEAGDLPPATVMRWRLTTPSFEVICVLRAQRHLREHAVASDPGVV